MTTQSEERIRVRFLTHYVQFRVTDEPFSVPISFGRYALSEVVNHLLGLDPAQPFDFLVIYNGNQRLLRTSLTKYMLATGNSKEDIVEIEYMPAITLSNESMQAECDAWIGSIDANTIAETVVTGGYDGAIRVFDSSLTQLTTYPVHDLAIRALAIATDSMNSYIYTASKDHTIVCTEYSASGCRQHASLTTHQSSVESLCVGKQHGIGQKLYSGDWEGGICIWDLPAIHGATVNAQSDLHKTKRQRAAEESTHTGARVTAEPLAVFKAHTQSMSGLECDDNNTTLYTASWDHSIKVWDIETQNCVMTFNGSKVVTSLSYGSAFNLIATSHPDGKVRIWDPRSGGENASVVKTSLPHNSQWVSSVKWTSESPAPLLASSDYDGSVRLWDMRGTVALGTHQAHDGKALCVDWIGGRGILSGGSDCVVRITNIAGHEEVS